MFRNNSLIGGTLYCDKCNCVIRIGIWAVSKAFVKKYSLKKKYCGICIRERVKNWDKFKDAF